MSSRTHASFEAKVDALDVLYLAYLRLQAGPDIEASGNCAVAIDAADVDCVCGEQEQPGILVAPAVSEEGARGKPGVHEA